MGNVDVSRLDLFARGFEYRFFQPEEGGDVFIAMPLLDQSPIVQQGHFDDGQLRSAKSA